MNKSYFASRRPNYAVFFSFKRFSEFEMQGPPVEHHSGLI